MHQGTIAKWESIGWFWGLLDGLGHSKTPLLWADLLKTSEQEMLENDGKDNEKIKKIEKFYTSKNFQNFEVKARFFQA